MNLLTIILIFLVLVKIVDGFQKGMVKEIISFVTLIVMSIVVVLIGSGLKSYMEKEYVGVVVAVLLLCILGIAHHLLGVIFFSAKMLAKLPVVHWVDKLLGTVVGALEIVLILWTVYIFIEKMGLGAIGRHIIEYTEESPILTLFYQHNYLAVWAEQIASHLTFVQF